jgi:hypothetical protein
VREYELRKNSLKRQNPESRMGVPGWEYATAQANLSGTPHAPEKVKAIKPGGQLLHC